TKAALNAVTTAAMVRLGKVYRGWMVDLRPASAKLRDRGARIVAEAAGMPRERAERLLAEAGGEVKTALVAALAGVAPEEARRSLDAAGGSVRRALET
ncbi:MAG TPA: N-acetylmuramic acid 6-phosphate etherase, partial [Thermoanaerobaculia bacterium]|nr:N-acetylmuramic acid 6-phosphate etherase [Thermoanaerobaculia bacterium]